LTSQLARLTQAGRPRAPQHLPSITRSSPRRRRPPGPSHYR
jgi:hypothetical protein